jgi:hypothetical protein
MVSGGTSSSPSRPWASQVARSPSPPSLRAAPEATRLGSELLAGAATSFAVLAVLGSVDLAWRGGMFGAAGTLAVLIITAPAIARATRSLDGGRSAAAWPWGALGPALVLLAVLVGPAGRVAVATGWGPGDCRRRRRGPPGARGARSRRRRTARTARCRDGRRRARAHRHGGSTRRGRRRFAVAGRLRSLRGSDPRSSPGCVAAGPSPRRRGVVAGASLVLFGALVFAAYAGYARPAALRAARGDARLRGAARGVGAARDGARRTART